jgi:hypothetical protein
MKKIALTKGQFAIVDEKNYERLMAHKWQATWNPYTHSYYATRTIRIEGRSTHDSMHREILNLKPGDKRHGDHWNHDTLDNTEGNLRIVTPSQNQHNRGPRRDNSSGFKGVYKEPDCARWRGELKVNRKNIYCGLHTTPELASAAVEAMRARLVPREA